MLDIEEESERKQEKQNHKFIEVNWNFGRETLLHTQEVHDSNKTR